MSAQPTTVSTSTEPRAKRTHARRSCQVCKVRKTRCELPDLSVPSSSTPLPEEQACHRCRVLALPCIVTDTDRVSKKRTKEGEAGPHASAAAGPSGSNTPRESLGAGSSVRGGEGPSGDVKRNASSSKRSKPNTNSETADKKSSASKVKDVDHSLEVMHAVHPSLTWATDAEVPPNLNSANPFFHSPQSPESVDGTDDFNSIKLHGRPLELLSAMLRTAYGKSRIQAGRSDYAYSLTNWDKLLDQSMRRQLEDLGYSQLRTYHPYLDPFDSQFDRLARSQACNDQLLLAIIIYLCTFPLPPSSAVTQLRIYLRPMISCLRDRVILYVPHSFSSVQALELLSLHAPLGVIPLQLTDPKYIALARGHMAALQSISSALGFERLFTTFRRLGPEHLWRISDAWLYMTIACQQASATLEDEVTKAPSTMADVRQFTAEWMQERNHHLWHTALEQYDVAEVVGRLSVCDRLNRIAEVIDSLERYRNIMDAIAADPNFDVIDAILGEFTAFATHAERCDRQHDAILAILSPQTRMIESGHLTYRSIRRRYEHSKVLGAGIRCLIALAFLPGQPSALPGLPEDMPVHHRVQYAMNRAYIPSDIMPALTRQSPATMRIWQYGPHREVQASAIIGAFAELDRKVIPHPRRETGDARADLVPMHELFAIAVESSKILMETRAGRIAMMRNRPDLQQAPAEPEWYASMRKAVNVLRRVDLLSTPYGGEGGEVKEVKPGEGETVANGCSNVIGSMLRLAEDWSKGIQKHSRSSAHSSASAEPASSANRDSDEARSDQPKVEPGSYDNSNGHTQGQYDDGRSFAQNPQHHHQQQQQQQYERYDSGGRDQRGEDQSYAQQQQQHDYHDGSANTTAYRSDQPGNSSQYNAPSHSQGYQDGSERWTSTEQSMPHMGPPPPQQPQYQHQPHPQYPPEYNAPHTHTHAHSLAAAPHAPPMEHSPTNSHSHSHSHSSTPLAGQQQHHQQQYRLTSYSNTNDYYPGAQGQGNFDGSGGAHYASDQSIHQHQQQPQYQQHMSQMPPLNGHPDGNNIAPTALDLLLGQMFNYASYQPPPPPPQEQGQGQQQHASESQGHIAHGQSGPHDPGLTYIQGHAQEMGGRMSGQ